MPTLYAYKITIINRERIIYNNAKTVENIYECLGEYHVHSAIKL